MRSKMKATELYTVLSYILEIWLGTGQRLKGSLIIYYQLVSTIRFSLFSVTFLDVVSSKIF